MSVEIQKQIRDNATSVNEYMKDLYDWTEDMNALEQKRKGGAKKAKFVPPPRGQVELPTKETAKATKGAKKEEGPKETNSNMKRDKTNMKEYYKNWDRYDPEAECAKLEDPTKPRVPNPERFEKLSQSRPNMRIKVRTGQRKEAVLDVAMALKKEANEYFSQGRYAEAVEFYGKALVYAEPLADPTSAAADEQAAREGREDNPADPAAIELAVVLFTNRGLAHFRKAEYLASARDCDRALELDASSLKARFRRGSAYAKLKKWQQAEEDLRAAVQGNPEDKKACAELEYVKRMNAAELARRRERARKLICTKGRKQKLPLRRLAVTRAGEAAPAAPAKPAPRRRDAPADTDGLQEPAPAAAAPAPPRPKYVPRAARMRSGNAAGVNSYTFERLWTGAARPRRLELLEQIGAELPQAIRESFSAELLAEICDTLALASDSVVATSLQALPETSRFHVSVGLLAEEERALLESLLARVAEACPGLRSRFFPDVEELAEMD